MAIQTGWREQYDRMLRSHRRLVDHADGRTGAGSDEVRDALFHFFQDAYHLKDWIKNDPGTEHLQPGKAVKRSKPLRIAADVCNGTKHFGLSEGYTPWTGDRTTAIDSQSVNVHIGSHVEHSWTINSNGKPWDALELAGYVIDDWTGWLRCKKLLGD